MYSGKSCSIQVKVVVFGQKWLYSGKVVVFRKSCCIRVKVVVFGQKWFYFGKSGCIRARKVVFGQSGCIREKVVLFG